MGELFRDFFRELPHCLKPESTRDQNYERLLKQLDRVRNQLSQHAQLEQALLNQAMSVFKDEQRYRDWRKKWEAIARGESKRDGEDKASSRKAEMAHERARKAEEAQRREAEKARALERELEEAKQQAARAEREKKQQAARAEREKKEAAEASKRPLWANLHLKIVGGAIGILVLTLWLYAPSQRTPTPTPAPEATLAAQEEEIYRSARSNLYNLRAYVNGCQICSYKPEALDEIRKLESDELAKVEAIAYQAARGNIASLQAYAISCQICAFKSAALEDIRNLEATARYFSFEVCNATSYGAEIAVVGRKNPDSDAWTVSGWWTVSANSCITIGGFAKGKFYSMATVHGELRGWYGGDTKQCVEFPGPFETVVRPVSGCGANSKIVGFQEFNVIGDSFTWRLSGEPSSSTMSSLRSRSATEVLTGLLLQ